MADSTNKATTAGRKGRAARKAAPYDVPASNNRDARRSDRVKDAEIIAKAKPKAFPFPGQVLLAQKWDEDSVDPTGWWMSEKLDGVRAYWSGKKFFTRNGNALIPPDWFTEEFPDDMSLDGELFGGRGMFQQTISIVKTQKDERWKNIRYKIFDTPSNGSQPFEKRMEILNDRFENGKAKYLSVVEHTVCRGKAHIEEELPKVLTLGGEGLMIREPKSTYEQRRSYTLLKIKKFYDAEAVVIGYEKSKSGAGGVGALRCRMECGKEMKVGSGLTNKDRRNPPKIGTIITYKFQEYSDSGSPRFPSYIGVRIDMDGPKDAVLPAKIKEAVE